MEGAINFMINLELVVLQDSEPNGLSMRSLDTHSIFGQNVLLKSVSLCKVSTVG
jgi:hypothetical protein